MFEPPQLPPAGWYPDPTNPVASRWWSGAAWAESGSAWHVSAPIGPADRLPDVGELLSGSFRRMIARWRALAVLAVLTATPAAIMSSLAIRRLVSGVRIVDDDIVGWSRDRVPTVIALVAGAAVLTLVGALGSALLMLDTVDDDGPTPNHVGFEPLPTPPRRSTSAEARAAAHALAAGLRVLPRAFGWFALLLIAGLGVIGIVVLVTLLAWPLGIVLIVVLLPVGVWVSVRLAFLAVAVVDRPGNPFARSWRVAAGRFWATFARLAMMGAITYCISAAVNTPASYAGGSMFGNSDAIQVTESGAFESLDIGELLQPSIAGIVIGGLTAIAIGVLATGTFNAALAAMYRSRNPLLP